MTYLLGNTDQITGYHLLWPGDCDIDYTLICCAHPPEGYLEVIDVVNCTMSKILNATNHMILKSDVDHNPKLAYDNYCKDQRVWQYYQCDYVTYMTNIIDALIGEANLQITDHDDTHDKSINELIAHQNIPEGMSTNSDEFKTFPQIESRNVNMTKFRAKDFNYPDKRTGYVTQVQTDFSFIGPDREPVGLDSIDTLLNIADIIRHTGQPNYKCARIPIKSGLQVEAWEKYLKDYSDRRVLQYIKFGFPLSLINPNELNNTEITNHFSACQYPR